MTHPHAPRGYDNGEVEDPDDFGLQLANDPSWYERETEEGRHKYNRVIQYENAPTRLQDPQYIRNIHRLKETRLAPLINILEKFEEVEFLLLLNVLQASENDRLEVCKKALESSSRVEAFIRAVHDNYPGGFVGNFHSISRLLRIVLPDCGRNTQVGSDGLREKGAGYDARNYLQIGVVVEGKQKKQGYTIKVVPQPKNPNTSIVWYNRTGIPLTEGQSVVLGRKDLIMGGSNPTDKNNQICGVHLPNRVKVDTDLKFGSKADSHNITSRACIEIQRVNGRIRVLDLGAQSHMSVDASEYRIRNHQPIGLPVARNTYKTGVHYVSKDELQKLQRVA